MAMRWHVLGAGSLGALFAARLARGGVSTTIVLKDETWDAIGRLSTSALSVREQCNNNHSWSARVNVQPVSYAGPVRRLLVTTKAPDVCAAVDGVADRLTDDAVVVVLCNGMGAYDELISRPKLSDVSFLLAATSLGAFTTKRMNCVHAGLGETWVGMPAGSAVSPEDARTTVASLQQTGLSVTLENSIERILWSKLAVNASLNGLTAIVGCRNGAVLHSDHGLSLIRMLCTEVGLVMEASNIPVPTDLLSMVLRVVRHNADNFSSMYQDVASGRATEADYINGFVVNRGALLGVPTPANGIIYDLIKMKEEIRL